MVLILDSSDSMDHYAKVINSSGINWASNWFWVAGFHIRSLVSSLSS
jgi:hypothetical protein